MKMKIMITTRDMKKITNAMYTQNTVRSPNVLKFGPNKDKPIPQLVTVCMCVRVCVCVCERERERERECTKLRLLTGKQLSK